MSEMLELKDFAIERQNEYTPQMKERYKSDITNYDKVIELCKKELESL